MAKELLYKYKFDKDLLAIRLREVVKESGFTRAEIKVLTGFSKRSQLEMESGHANITDDTRLGYLEGLGISQYYFYHDIRFDYIIKANKKDTEVKPSGNGLVELGFGLAEMRFIILMIRNKLYLWKFLKD